MVNWHDTCPHLATKCTHQLLAGIFLVVKVSANLGKTQRVRHVHFCSRFGRPVSELRWDTKGDLFHSLQPDATVAMGSNTGHLKENEPPNTS